MFGALVSFSFCFFSAFGGVLVVAAYSNYWVEGSTFENMLDIRDHLENVFSFPRLSRMPLGHDWVACHPAQATMLPEVSPTLSEASPTPPKSVGKRCRVHVRVELYIVDNSEKLVDTLSAASSLVSHSSHA